jgi:uncharacterized membrane protein YhhN
MSKFNVFSGFAYFFTGILFMLSPLINSDLTGFLLKCLIIPFLIFFFLTGRHNEHHKEDKLVFIALIFSWIGDVLLEIKNGGELMFLLGLLAFLTTHIFYTIVFFHTAGEFTFFKTKKLLIIVIILYGTLTIYTILPGLGSMQIPVTIYGIIITGMVIAALSRFGKVNESSYLLVFLGALLFLISDSLIAFNKFKQAFPFSGILIMGTYLSGQFMIVLGLLRQYKRSDLSD